jgi:hypothetical protein
MREMDLRLPWLKFDVEKMGGQKTRYFLHGPNVQMKRQGEWPAASLATYVPVVEIKEETKERVCTVAGIIVTFLTTAKGEGGNEYFPFKEIYFNRGSPGLTTHLNAEFSMKIRDIDIKISTITYIDEYFRDEYTKDDVHYCFQLDRYLFEAPVESWPSRTVKLGWKKYVM